MSDCIRLADAIYQNGDPTPPDASDADDDGDVDGADVVYLCNYALGSGPKPEQPYPDPGPDCTADDLNACFEVATPA